LKRLIVIIGLIAALLMALPSSHSHNPESHTAIRDTPNISGTGKGFVVSLWNLLEAFAVLDLALQLKLWRATPPELRPILGLVKLILWGLTILGLMALQTLDKLLSRL
jgi:hypothetical protein